MSKDQSNKQLKRSLQLIDCLSAFGAVSGYSVALAAAEIEKMKSFHSQDFVLDWAYVDVFENRPSSAFVAIFPNLDPPARRMFLPADQGLSPHPKPTNKPSIYILADAIRPYLL